MMMTKKVFAAMLLVCLFFSFPSLPSHGQQKANLSLKVDSTRKEVDTLFHIELNISNVERLFGYSIDIRYNHRLMSLHSIDEGDFFSSRGFESFFQQVSERETGVIKLASAILGRSNYASGEGTLVVLAFKATYEGNARIQFSSIALKDDELNDIGFDSNDLDMIFYIKQSLPILGVQPEELDFGSVDFGAQPEKTFRITNTGEGDLTGEVNSLNPWLRVRPQQFQGDTEFTVTIISQTLPPNANYEGSIAIRSNGGNGQVKVRLRLIRDVKRDPPSLYILTPDEGLVTRQTRLFILCETDPGAFASINRQVVPVDAEDGIFFLNTTLREGINTFEISVWDAYENRRTETISVTRRTIPPEIVLSDVPMFTQEEEVRVQGKTDPDATLYFNRQPVQIARDGSFSVSYTIRSEINQLVFTAVDELGNSRTMVKVVFYRSVYPNTIVLVVGSNTASFNERSFSIDAPPILLEGRVMVPIRIIAEIFGAEIDWMASTKTVVISLRYEEIVLVVGSKQAMVNGKPVNLDVAPVIDNGRLMVPIRFISEIFRAVVEWDQELRKVTIRF